MTLTNNEIEALTKVVKLPTFEPSGDEFQTGTIEETIKSPFLPFSNTFFLFAEYRVIEFNTHVGVKIDEVGLFVGDMEEVELTYHQTSILEKFIIRSIESDINVNEESHGRW